MRNDQDRVYLPPGETWPGHEREFDAVFLFLERRVRQDNLQILNDFKFCFGMFAFWNSPKIIDINAIETAAII